MYERFSKDSFIGVAGVVMETCCCCCCCFLGWFNAAAKELDQIPDSRKRDAEVVDLVRGGVLGWLEAVWTSEMLDWLERGQGAEETELGDAGGDPSAFGTWRGVSE